MYILLIDQLIVNKRGGVSVAEWLEHSAQNHKAVHLCRPAFESRPGRYVSKFASLLAEDQWSLTRYNVSGLSPPPTKKLDVTR